MATAHQLSGAQSIRSLRDEDAIFRAFDSYPWTKDTAFMSGLNAILGDPNSPNQMGSPVDMAIHARIFYYSQRIGVRIDFAAYQSWLANHEQHHHSAPDILPPEYLSRINSNAATAAAAAASSADAMAPLLDWQKAAPKADLYIDRSTPAGIGTGTGTAPPYSTAFTDMLQLIQQGKQVPGIRQIPDTIVRDPAVKPMGSRTAPPKPWEQGSAATSHETYRTTALDMEFPPVEDPPH